MKTLNRKALLRRNIFTVADLDRLEFEFPEVDVIETVDENGMEVDVNDEDMVLKVAISNTSHVLEATVRVA